MDGLGTTRGRHALPRWLKKWRKLFLVYVAVYVLDVIDSECYRGRGVPAADRGQWRVQLGDSQRVVVRICSGEPPEVGDPTIRVESLSGVDHDLRSVAVLEFPAQRLAAERLNPGDRIDLDAGYVTHGRAHRIEWKSGFTLSE